jgi:methylisocitrate lyase
VTAPLVLNPLMARMAEAAGFPAGYLGGGSTGYQKVALEANLNVTEMCQTAVDIGAVSSLPLILDGACGYGDPMHMHRTIGMSEAAGFQAIEIEDQLVPKRAHHHAGIEHMISLELMAAKVKEAVAARRNQFPHRRAHQRDPGQQHGRRSGVAGLPPAPICCCSRWRTSRSGCARSRSGSAGR